MTGSVIPAVLISGINSDLPGPILAQVSQNVYDSTGVRSLLIPQGSRLIGSYRSAAAFGQSRVQIQWQRLIFPNTASMEIPPMPGTDEAGYAGFTDQVNNHYVRTFATAALMSLISAGQAVGQMATFGGGMGGPLGYYQPNQWAMASQMAGSSASSQFGSVGQQAIEQGMSTGPTLDIRPGYQFNVMVTQDLLFPVHTRAESYTKRTSTCARMYTGGLKRRAAMGVLKKNEERTETVTIRIPSSVKAEIDQLRDRAEATGFDLNATMFESLTRLVKQIREELDGIGATTSNGNRARATHVNGLTRAGSELSQASTGGANGE
jgi:hypothetical protein